MLYMILATDVDDSTALRQQHRPAHLARLEKMNEEGRLVLAGPTPYPEQEGVSGSLLWLSLRIWMRLKLGPVKTRLP